MFATFSTGNHPNPAVKEEGLSIELHVLRCSRSHPSRAVGIPVAYISKHAMNRLYERGHDITENSHATGAFAFIGVLGYLTHHSAKHVDGGMHMAFSDLLMVGTLHRFMKTYRNGKQVEETIYDVRTVLRWTRSARTRQGSAGAGQSLPPRLLSRGSRATILTRAHWRNGFRGSNGSRLFDRTSVKVVRHCRLARGRQLPPRADGSCRQLEKPLSLHCESGFYQSS